MADDIDKKLLKLRILIIFCHFIWLTSNTVYCGIMFEDFLFLQMSIYSFW